MAGAFRHHQGGRVFYTWGGCFEKVRGVLAMPFFLPMWDPTATCSLIVLPISSASFLMNSSERDEDEVFGMFSFWGGCFEDSAKSSTSAMHYSGFVDIWSYSVLLLTISSFKFSSTESGFICKPSMIEAVPDLWSKSDSERLSGITRLCCWYH